MSYIKDFDDLMVGGLVVGRPSLLFVYDAVGNRTVGTSKVALSFDTQVVVDSDYSFSAGVVTFNVSGWFLVVADVCADVTDTGRSHADWNLQVDSGSGFVDLAGSFAFTYHRTSADGKNSASISYFFNASGGDKLRVVGKSDRATQVKTVPGGCRLLIRRLR